MYGGDANKGSDPGDQSVLNEMEMYNTLSTNDYLEQKWKWTYKGAKRVNIALNIMAKAEDMGEAQKKLRTGELKFLRAMFYFEGVKVFGPMMPWVDDTIAENDPKVHNDTDIYPKIIADLDAAIGALPEKTETVGRINVWAAKALKAKVLMQQGKLADAKPILADVIANGKTTQGVAYGLENDLNANWDALRENGKEAIFAIQFSNDAEDNGNSGMSLCYPHNTGPGGCCGFYQPSFELVNSYQVDEDGLPYLDGSYRTMPSVSTATGKSPIAVNDAKIAVDPRLDFAVGRIGIPYKDWGKPKDDWVRNPVNGGIFLPKKHIFSKAEETAGQTALHSGWAPGSTMNIQYLSLRDCKLLYAECLANEGNLSGAMAQVNDIRERAANPINLIKNEDGKNAANYQVALYPSTHTTYSNKTMCIKAIRMERKLELAMEGQRWFDLQRWGGEVMASELKAYVDYEKQYIAKFASASYLPASKTLFAVPDGQIQTMGNDENGKPYLVQPAAWK